MTLKIINIETEKGNEIIDALKKEGWKQVKQYSPFAFDKGIDFDSYTLRNGGLLLKFEWCNWFEWEVEGPSEVLKKLAEDYGLKLS